MPRELTNLDLQMDRLPEKLLDLAKIVDEENGGKEIYLTQKMRDELRPAFKFVVYAIIKASEKLGLDLETLIKKIRFIRILKNRNRVYTSDHTGNASFSASFIDTYMNNLYDFTLTYEYEFLSDAVANYKDQSEFQPSLGAIIFNTLHEIDHYAASGRTNVDSYESARRANEVLQIIGKGLNWETVYDFVYICSSGEEEAEGFAISLAQDLVDNEVDAYLDELVKETLRDTINLAQEKKEESLMRVNEFLQLRNETILNNEQKQKAELIIQLYLRGLINKQRLPITEGDILNLQRLLKNSP